MSYMFCSSCGCTSHDDILVCPECGDVMVRTGDFHKADTDIHWGDVCVTVGVFALLSSVALSGIWAMCEIVDAYGGQAWLQLFGGI